MYCTRVGPEYILKEGERERNVRPVLIFSERMSEKLRFSFRPASRG